MSYSIIIIITFLIIGSFFAFLNAEDYEFHRDDFAYFIKSKFNQNYLLNNNLLDKPEQKKSRFAIITFENRKDKYTDLHNKNIQNYCDKWNYKYFFYDKCEDNVYWCKMYMVLNALKSGDYDYVMWMDSDSVIKNNNISLDSIVNKYSSDIFVTFDNKYSVFNAGIFIIKNSPIGLEYMEECIKNNRKDCSIPNSIQLRGQWTGLCYEQGVMNKLIFDRYEKYSTGLPNYIVYNMNINDNMETCNSDTFILHLYGSSDELRTKCFLRYV
jgi:hypothetical protein